MIESVAFVLAGYAGFAGWPWWYAALIGSAAGVWNACHRFYLGPWRDRLAGQGLSGVRANLSLLLVGIWTGTILHVWG